MWQLREKERGVCQLSPSLSYFASALCINSSWLLYNFCCNYSFSLSLSSLSPIWHPLLSQPLILSCNPMLSCSVWTLTPGLVSQLSGCCSATPPRNSSSCTSPPPYPSAKMLLLCRKMAGANTLASQPVVVDSLAHYSRTDHRVLCKGHCGVALSDYALVSSARISISSLAFCSKHSRRQAGQTVNKGADECLKQRETPGFKTHITTLRTSNMCGSLSKYCGESQWQSFPEINKSIWVSGLRWVSVYPLFEDSKTQTYFFKKGML